MNRFVCIHGHFYQPPRENAWLEQVEVQDSARPYHDWNERVTAECYAPNTASRILDAEERIIDIVNNFASISFDAGPTLLAWMERTNPSVYGAILEADRQSRDRFRGHGGAMAQAFNHLIMPLATSRDKRTQVLWGIRDFESRFGRKPEGMWLPETAVDLESLDIMAENGIRFTVLSPYQAAETRADGDKDWTDVRHGRIDPRVPYRCDLPSGRSIALFFYDGLISHDIAFGKLLENGEEFAKRLVRAFSEPAEHPEIVHVATDGETYGHHHRFGDMALAYCLRTIRANSLAEVTVYGDMLERFPPRREARIIERSAWSCAHGVERWRSDCGDSTGAHPKWNQKWRSPLREAVDWLGARAAAVYEKEMAAFSPDPWEARDAYIDVILGRSEGAVEAFLSRHIPRPLSPADKTRVLKLLEIERHAMLAATSDGWFFDDISNVETVQIVQYAGRGLQLLRDITGRDAEPEFLRILAKAVSNVPGYGTGAEVYERFVRPAFVDFLRLGAHYAVSSLFEEYPKAAKIAQYSAAADVCEHEARGAEKLAVGRVTLKSTVTLEEHTVAYAAIHQGGQDLTASVREYQGPDGFDRVCAAIREAFRKGDEAELLRLVERDFGTRSYSLWHLFKDERRRVVSVILDSTIRGIEAAFRQIVEANRPLMTALGEMQIPLPEALADPAELVLNADFRRLMAEDDIDLVGLRKIVREFRTWGFEPDKTASSFAAGLRVDALMARAAADPKDAGPFRVLVEVFEALKPLGLDLDLWKSQNAYFSLSRTAYGPALERARRGDVAAKRWVRDFEGLGVLLRVDPASALGKRE